MIKHRTFAGVSTRFDLPRPFLHVTVEETPILNIPRAELVELTEALKRP